VESKRRRIRRVNHWQTTLAILAMLSTLKKEVGGALIKQLKNMPYGEPKSDRKNKAGED
jgi:hypothetical protein